jgi:superfamily II DNA/RNA helicase
LTRYQLSRQVANDRENSSNDSEVDGTLASLVLGAIVGHPVDQFDAAAADECNSLDHLVMVFLNTAAASQQFAAILKSKGVAVLEYHNLVPKREREENINLFRNCAEHLNELNKTVAVIKSYPRVLVCTDSVCRGLDLPAIRHVVQAQFALNVVQHLHRVGRASRAGRVGKATNFYNPSVSALVNSIQSTGRASMTGASGSFPSTFEDGTFQSPDGIQHSFSRKRGFRRNLRRERAYALSMSTPSTDR